MSVQNVDLIQCLSKEVICMEDGCQISTQSEHKKCLKNNVSSDPPIALIRTLAHQVSADEVLDDDSERTNKKNKKRKQLVRQQATTEEKCEQYDGKYWEHQEQCSLREGQVGRETSQLSSNNQSLPTGSEQVPKNIEVLNCYGSRASSQTERIIYSERIDISPCSISSYERFPGYSNQNQEWKGISKFKKQRTIESAPSRYGSSRYLPKQYSVASSSSAYLSIQPSSPSNLDPKLTLVRGQSCSLVDIPTYLGSSVELASVKEFNGIESIIIKTLPPTTLPVIKHISRQNVRRLKEEILKHRKQEKPPRKTQWMLLCIAIAFLTTCIALVGTMLSYTSEYQDRAVAKKMFYNDQNIIAEQNNTFSAGSFKDPE